MNRLIHGDARVLLAEVASRSVNLILTDPPFGQGYISYRRKVRTECLVGDENAETALPLVLDCLPDLRRVITDDGHLLMFLPARYAAFTAAVVLEAAESWERVQLLTWNKRIVGLGPREFGFRPQSELILWAYDNGAYWLEGMRGLSDLLSITRHSSSTNETGHPTAKPVDLMATLIGCTTRPGDLVLDPFAGSGSSLLAARSLGRDWLGFEIDEGHYRRALARLGGADLDHAEPGHEAPLFGQERG